MIKSTLSKTQYIKGHQCSLALWYYRNRKDLKKDIDDATQMRFDVGNEVGSLARKYFSKGVSAVEDNLNIQKAVQSTQQLIIEGVDTIYEAAALNPVTGDYSSIDVFHKSQDGNSWDLIEVKSSTNKKDYHIDDMAFQYYVFSSAGYKISNCYLMLINNEYVREDEIDPSKLFKLTSVYEEVVAKQDFVEKLSIELNNIVKQKDIPVIEIGSRCLKPFECEYKYHCWKNVPNYSIYNAFSAKKADEIYVKTKSYDVKDLSTELFPKGLKAIDVKCYKGKEEYKEKENILKFLNSLEYPCYFIDYETIMSAIPLYKGTRPYQQIPFQFSLHVQKTPEGKPDHYEYLHKEQSDPRPKFLDNLLESCGKSGSILVYNKSFEINLNKELALDFPGYALEIEAINKGVVDLMEPFSKRWIYNYKQLGSFSIKNVLPAYVPDLSYNDLDIMNGVDAMNNYVRFVKGSMPQKKIESLWSKLHDYCEMDTNAMVWLLKALKFKVS